LGAGVAAAAGGPRARVRRPARLPAGAPALHACCGGAHERALAARRPRPSALRPGLGARGRAPSRAAGRRAGGPAQRRRPPPADAHRRIPRRPDQRHRAPAPQRSHSIKRGRTARGDARPPARPRPTMGTMPNAIVLERLPAPAPDPTMVRRRVYIFFTRPGLLFLITLVVMLLGAVNYTNSMAYLLTFLLGSLLLVCILHTHRNLRGLVV